jgi:hypothetical protein
VAITNAVFNYRLECSLYQDQIKKTSVKDRVYNFISNLDNYKKAIIEGIVLHLLTNFSPAVIAEIIAVSSSIDLTAHVVNPSHMNQARISSQTAILTALAAKGYELPLVIGSIFRLVF